MPNGYQNSKWPYIHWSWDSVHLPEEAHNDRDTINTFLRWLDSKASALTNQPYLNKNQLQALLLGLALILRDLELSCFVDQNETSVPEHLVNSCMKPDDIGSVASILETISTHLE